MLSLAIIGADEYISQRLDNQIAWYGRKSLWNRRLYNFLRTVELVSAVLVTFFAAYLTPELPATKAAIGLLGVVIAAITATLGSYQFYEHWVRSQMKCESLKREKHLFLTLSGPYKEDSLDQFRLLVERVEALISNENTNILEP